MIVDVHNHVGEDCCDAFGSSLEAKTFEETLDQHGIDRAVIFPLMHHHGYARSNREIADIVAERPRLTGFGRLDPLGPDPWGELEQIQDLGLSGVKVHTRHFRVDAPQLTPLWEAVSETGLPLILHTGVPDTSRARRVGPLVAHFDFEAVILAHCGKFYWRDAADLAAEHDEVYVDTSVQTASKIRKAIGVCGAEKVLFASDQPYSHPSIELPKIDLAVPDKADREKVLGGNARRVLGL